VNRDSLLKILCKDKSYYVFKYLWRQQKMKQLNQLLAKAKDSEQIWQDFQAVGDWRREGRAPIYRQREQDWRNLYKAIDANVPVRFVAAAGDVKTFATIGAMD
jgi:hypothetical protein